MRTLFKAALTYLLVSVLSSAAMADAEIDQLLNQIDADITAKRLSNPAGNNAIEKIWQFKALAPYDQRINSRVQQVGSTYVNLAERAIAGKKLTKAQLYLDNAWTIAYLTPGLEGTQDKLDKLTGGSSKIASTPKQKAPSKPIAVNTPKAPVKAVAKVDTKKDNEKAKQAAREKQLAATRLAKERAQKEAASKRREAEERERRLAQLRKEEQSKRNAAAKLAELESQRKRAQLARQAINEAEEKSKPIADFNLEQELIDDRETRQIRTALEPICQEIINNDASVVLHTRSTQDYRWLTVRLTLCVRRIDKGFRLRHSHQQVAEAEPSISLHPGRESALLKQL